MIPANQPESELLTMLCNRCNAENIIVENKRFRKVLSCTSCNGILYELDDLSENFRITRNFRIYYRNLSSTLHDIQNSIRKKESEIKNIENADVLAEWQNAITQNHIFEKDVLNMLNTAIILLENENKISDPDTMASTADFIQTDKDLLLQMNQIKSFNEISLIKLKCKEIQEFTRIFDRYLGEPGRV